MQPQVKVEDIGNEAMAAQQGGRGDEFDRGNTKGREGICFWCGKSGHITAKCVADMPPNVKTKILSHFNSENVADVEDYAFLTNNLENIALFSAFHMEENISWAAVFDLVLEVREWGLFPLGGSVMSGARERLCVLSLSMFSRWCSLCLLKGVCGGYQYVKLTGQPHTNSYIQRCIICFSR